MENRLKSERAAGTRDGARERSTAAVGNRVQRPRPFSRVAAAVFSYNANVATPRYVLPYISGFIPSPCSKRNNNLARIPGGLDGGSPSYYTHNTTQEHTHMYCHA